MGIDWTSSLLVLNCALIIVFQLGVVYFSELSIALIMLLQNSVPGEYQQRVAWGIAEFLGPDPKFFTLFFTLVFADSGEEASLWILLRFLAVFVRWVLGMMLQEPRPSWLSDDVHMWHCAQTFGLPAGHALLLSALGISFCLRRKWYYTPLVVLWYVAMCVGRMYIGTHSLHDLLLGTTIGINLVTATQDDKNFVQGVRRFFYDQGALFVVLLLSFGITSSVGFTHILASMGNENALMVFRERVAVNHCPKIHPYSAVDGCVAFTGLAGLLFSMSMGRFHLQRSFAWRCASLGVFLLPSFVELGFVLGEMRAKTFWELFNLPSHTMAVLTALCNMGAIMLMFTGPSIEQEVEQRRRMYAQQHDEAASLYGTLPPRRGGSSGGSSNTYFTPKFPIPPSSPRAGSVSARW